MATQQFISNSTVTYDVATDGTTSVTHDITLQNATSDFYATSYTLSISGITPINPKAYEGNAPIPIKVTSDKGVSSLQVDFPDAVVGKDNKREFQITFNDKTLVNKSGEIWEITTPRLTDSTSFDFFSTIIKIPNSFGTLAYVSPNPTFKEEVSGKQVYSFDKAASLNTAITAAFGKFQVFSYEFTYHIENPLGTAAQTEIALPPDTNYQKMNYTNMNPRPSKITIDADGNWLATYELKAHEKSDVKVSGAVQIFPEPVAYPRVNYTNVTKDLAATDLWQVNDPKIQAFAKELKTPKAIYDYVAKTLSYDYARVAPNVERLGAIKALENPKQAICTEFTDLFIAIARAAGIPAREVEGYAYTENPQIQPLSLVADVLHAWPEYWDTKSQSWIPIDPTWGSTSGIDYFSKLDLRHFAFAIHGADPHKPYPAGSYKFAANPQKDVNVTFGSLPTNRAPFLTIQNSILSQLPFSDEVIDAKIQNSGATAIYEPELKIMYDNKTVANDFKIPVIPPFGYYETKINVPYSFLGQKVPAKIEVLIDGQKKTEFSTYKTFVTISNLLMLMLFAFFILFLVYLKFRDIKHSLS